MAKKVKWGIGSQEPDDVGEFLSNDDIVGEHGLPPKGKTRVLIKRVTMRENRNHDDMLTVLCEIAIKGSKKDQRWNGYAMWENLNVTEQGAPFIKRFLKGIGATWDEFHSNTLVDESKEPTVITKIGKVKLDRPLEAMVSVGWGTHYSTGEDQAEVSRFLPREELNASDDEDEDDDDIEPDEDEDVEVVEDEDEDSDEDEDEEDDLQAELSGMKLADLRKRAIRAGADDDDLPKRKAGLIDLIMELESESDEDDDEEDDEPEDDEPAYDEDELDEMSIKELRDIAKEHYGAAKVKGVKRGTLIEMIMEAPPF